MAEGPDERLARLAERLSGAGARGLTTADVWEFYQCAEVEQDAAGLTAEEQAALFDYKCGLGPMLGRGAYFRQAYCRPLRDAVQAIFAVADKPRILDLCSGTGGQAILFALLGARVVGVDRDVRQLRVARKRLDAWSRGGVPTSVNLIEADVLTFDPAAHGCFDAAYSHIGIGGLEDAPGIFARVAPCLATGGRLVLKAGNPACLWLRAVGRRAADSARREYMRAAEANGFRTRAAQGTTGIPRPLWRAGELTRLPDALLRRIPALQINVHYVFEKQ